LSAGVTLSFASSALPCWLSCVCAATISLANCLTSAFEDFSSASLAFSMSVSLAATTVAAISASLGAALVVWVVSGVVVVEVVVVSSVRLAHEDKASVTMNSASTRPAGRVRLR
jgi:hypothetical protein